MIAFRTLPYTLYITCTDRIIMVTISLSPRGGARVRRGLQLVLLADARALLTSCGKKTHAQRVPARVPGGGISVEHETYASMSTAA